MRLLRSLVSVALILLLVFVASRGLRTTPGRTADRSPAPASRPIDGGRAIAVEANSAFARSLTLQRLAYAQDWAGPQPPALAAFRDWAERYRRTPMSARASLEAEGVALAQARRPEMLNLIQTDPQRALAVTVPAIVRAALPAAVVAELETRVAGRGDFETRAGIPELGATDPIPERRIAFIGGVAYAAHPYGRREAQLTKDGASLHGVALEGHLALHESPVRAFEPGEALAGSLDLDPHCPVSGNPVDALPVGTGANTGALTVAAAFGRTWEFCADSADMLEQFEHQLVTGETSDNPNVALPGAPRPTAADAQNSHSSGTQRVLVIRVDFSDFSGAAVSASEAQSTMDTSVKSFFEECSYGQATLTTTVSANVYRLPQTGTAYALATSGGVPVGDSQIHSDARSLASADYTLANFDRIIVVFPSIGSSRVSGSKITFGGEGSVNGSSIWLNGSFSFRLLVHELGHTFGFKHANLWQVTDGDPVSPNGSSVEYKDPFDAMGDSSSADARFHYNPWFKNRIGWLPDSAVATVTTSGTYRVYRYDHKDALGLNQTLALKIFRDGVRSYWIGLRGNFPTNSSLSNGAYVLWGTNNLQQTHLLDLTTPGANASDAALAVGATFTDSAYGISIKVLARGGTDPAQYLDLEITVPDTPTSVTAWGKDGAYFYDAAGVIPTPTTETFVPAGLTGVRALAAGDTHVLALKSDGSLVAWGNNTNGQTTVPDGLTNIASIAAGGNVSGVVKTDGTVQMWGSNASGQITPPAGLSGVKQLAIGRSHVLALKTDGTVVGWGTATLGELSIPAGLSNISAIAAGAQVSVALSSAGNVTRWGANFTGVAFPSGLTGVVAISACGANTGGQFAMALKSDGTVVAWGANTTGQATVPTGLSNVVAIAAGGFHGLALRADGTVVGWGTAAGGSNVPLSLPRAHLIAATQLASFALTGSNAYLLNQPQAASVAATTSTILSVAAVGGGTLSYQWSKDGVAIPGATASTLTLSNVAASAAGSYSVAVTDPATSSTLTSFPARVTVTAAPTVAQLANPAHLINLSVLAPLTIAGDSFSLGYVVSGATAANPKQLVIRVAGPSLGALGVPGTLVDPKMELFAGAAKVTENDDWGGSTATTNAMAAVGGFPYTGPTSRDSALAASITGRDNSVKVSAGASTPAGTGTVIAEVYDATPTASFNATTTPRLVNFSVIKNVGTSVTLGFVVGGEAGNTQRVLVRAIGPTLGLAPFGVGGAMPDPKVELFDVTGKSLATSDNWGGNAALSTVFTQTGAFTLASTSKDAALVATLAPGNYSVVVTPAAGTTGGTALLEVYDVP